MSEADKVVPLYPVQPPSDVDPAGDPVNRALKRIGPILEVDTPSPDPFAHHKPNWTAISVLLSLGVSGYAAAYFMPQTADSGIRFGAAMAMVFGMISIGAALLMRYGREFWVKASKPNGESR